MRRVFRYTWIGALLRGFRAAIEFERQTQAIARLFPVAVDPPRAALFCYSCNEYGWPSCCHRNKEKADG